MWEQIQFIVIKQEILINYVSALELKLSHIQVLELGMLWNLKLMGMFDGCLWIHFSKTILWNIKYDI